jgi:hypothetical protein
MIVERMQHDFDLSDDQRAQAGDGLREAARGSAN